MSEDNKDQTQNTTQDGDVNEDAKNLDISDVDDLLAEVEEITKETNVVKNASDLQDHDNNEKDESADLPENDPSAIEDKSLDGDEQEDAIPLEDAPNETKLSFDFDEDKKEFVATFKAGEKKKTISVKFIRGIIHDEGYDELLKLNKKIEQLVDSVNAHEDITIPIAKVTDSTVDLWVSHDAMRAYITCEPAHGGKNLTKEDFQKLLDEEGISTKCNEDVVDLIIHGKFIENRLITEGTYPLRSISKFERQIEKKIDGPTEVSENQCLMKRSKTGNNIPGNDVFLNSVTPIPEKSKQFINHESSAVNKEKLFELMTTTTGQPVFEDRGFKLDTIVNYKSVNNKTKPLIRHEGSIFIDGDVESDVEIHATGDVIINGIVSNAKIYAGGDILISQGIIGGNKKTVELDEETAESIEIDQFSSQLSAGGMIRASFVDHSLLEAKNDIIINEYICHSNVRSQEKVIIGYEGGSGKIIGGLTYARVKIIANIIGTSAHAFTDLVIGPHKSDILAMKKCHRDIMHEDIRLHALRTALKAIEKSSDDMTLSEVKAMEDPIKEDIENLIMDVTKHTSEYDSLYSKVEHSNFGYVDAKTELHGNVTVHICNREVKLLESSSGAHIFLKGNEIMQGNIDS